MALLDLLVGNDLRSQGLGVVLIGMPAKHIHQGGVGLDVGTAHGSNRDRLLRPAFANGGADRLEEIIFQFVGGAVEIMRLRLIAEIPDEDAIIVGQRCHQRLHIIQRLFPSGPEIFHIGAAVIVLGIVPAVEQAGHDLHAAFRDGGDGIQKICRHLFGIPNPSRQLNPKADAVGMHLFRQGRLLTHLGTVIKPPRILNARRP